MVSKEYTVLESQNGSVRLVEGNKTSLKETLLSAALVDLRVSGSSVEGFGVSLRGRDIIPDQNYLRLIETSYQHKNDAIDAAVKFAEGYHETHLHGPLHVRSDYSRSIR